MNLQVPNIEKLKLITIAAWFISIVAVIICSKYIKAALVYLLIKLYEFLIQRNLV
jgi:hypothetical protein